MSSVQITPSHFARKAAIYIRQSSPGQVLHNRESQRLQYGLVDRAVNLGWPRSQVIVIDEDLGVSGGGGITRIGFDRLVDWATSALSYPSKSRAWLATTATGTTCWTCVPWWIR